VINIDKKYTQGKRRVTFALSDASEFRQELLDFSLDPLGAKPLVAARGAYQQRFAMRTDFRYQKLLFYLHYCYYFGLLEDLVVSVLNCPLRGLGFEFLSGRNIFIGFCSASVPGQFFYDEYTDCA